MVSVSIMVDQGKPGYINNVLFNESETNTVNKFGFQFGGGFHTKHILIFSVINLVFVEGDILQYFTINFALTE